MRKLLAAAHKELLLLTRDIGGLAVLFLMPLLLVIVITLVQDGSFKTIKQNKIPIILVDNDKGEVSQNILENLRQSQMFEVSEDSDEKRVQELIQNGVYQLAVVIPENLTHDLNQKVTENVEGILEKFGMDEGELPLEKSNLKAKEVKLYFDPATQFSFRNSIKSGIDQMVSKIETQTIYKVTRRKLFLKPKALSSSRR